MRRAVVALGQAVLLAAVPALASNGGAGDDLLVGTRSADVLKGGDGQDVVLGHAGDDDLHGGPGVDFIKGGRGIDVCYVTRGDVARGCEVLLAPPVVIGPGGGG